MLHYSCYSNRFILSKFFELFKGSYRSVFLQLPDLENERLLRENKEKFDELFSKLKLPFKLKNHFDESREFIKQRLEQYPDGFKVIEPDRFIDIWRNESNPVRRQKLIEDINLVLIYYNNILRPSLFAPSTIFIKDMRKMMFQYDNHKLRFSHLHFLFIREFDSWRKNIQIPSKNKEDEYFEQIGCFNLDGDLQYGYWRNTLFTRYFEKAINLHSFNSLRRAEMFDQPIVIDCSLEHRMVDYEILSCCRQISRIYHLNRNSKYPFRLLFTGYDREKNPTYQYLKNTFGYHLQKPECHLNIHRESYQELLPGERFIYLSPYSNKIMYEFDPKVVYIIGGLVSKTYKEKLSEIKAKKEGLECLRLPLHYYVELKPMVKRKLSFLSVFQILLELKHGIDWKTALYNSIQENKLVDGNRL